MMLRIVVASRNQHKIDEIQRILRAEGVDVDLVSLADFPDAEDVAETESTFAGNALLKARAACHATGLAAIADDSGLCVDALNGMPGIFSARWAGSHGDDTANLELLLAQLTDVPDARRSAHFICAIAYVTPDGKERIVEGTIDGQIIREPRGDRGFGYDPIFVPDGMAQTTAELTSEQKDRVSHRGRALRAFAQLLNHS